VLEVFRKLGSIQFDPIAVAGRNHDLVLHARVAGYEPAWCDELYERREIFEATNKALSFVPTSEFPWFRHVWGRKGPRFHAAALADNAAVAERVLERIRAEGRCRRATSSARAADEDWFGMPRTPCAPCSRRTPSRACSASRGATATSATTTSSSGCSRPRCSRRRCRSESSSGTSSCRATARTACSAPAAPAARSPASPAEAARAVGRNDAAQGARRARRARARRGRGRARQALRPRRGARAAAGAAGAAAVRRVHRPVRLAAVGHRLLASLFDFEYVWEGFFPPAKRRWGYYVLPILFGDRFVGRIEPRIDRETGACEVLGVWWEDGFAPRRADGFVDAMRDALARVPALRGRRPPRVGAAPRREAALIGSTHGSGQPGRTCPLAPDPDPGALERVALRNCV
jgi:hypothetical protein